MAGYANLSAPLPDWNMIDADIPFNRAIIGNHVAAAIALARDAHHDQLEVFNFVRMGTGAPCGCKSEISRA